MADRSRTNSSSLGRPVPRKNRWLPIGIGLGAVRVTALLLLVYGKQSISLLPLVFLLYPEALLLKTDVAWTPGNVIGFATLLMIGSSLLTGLAAFIFHFSRRK